jgi:hypothetical protein
LLQSQEVDQLQADLREKLRNNSASPMLTKSNSGGRGRGRKKNRAPPPPGASEDCPSSQRPPSETLQITIGMVGVSGASVSPGVSSTGSESVSRDAVLIELAENAPAHWCHPVAALVDGSCDFRAQVRRFNLFVT